MSGISNTKRIARNTLMLYFRQILIMLVSLYTVRVVLNVLGAEDYGIYGVVGGVVTFFSFLSGTMASATQRFFSFALGKNDVEKLKQSFCINFLIYVAIGLLAAKKQMDYVTFTGYTKDVADYCRLSDLLVMPSFQEGLPMAMIEAIATGLPV